MYGAGINPPAFQHNPPASQHNPAASQHRCSIVAGNPFWWRQRFPSSTPDGSPSISTCSWDVTPNPNLNPNPNPNPNPTRDPYRPDPGGAGDQTWWPPIWRLGSGLGPGIDVRVRAGLVVDVWARASDHNHNPPYHMCGSGLAWKYV